MKFLSQIVTATTLLVSSTLLLAHAGHHGEGMTASLLHSFSGSELFLGIALLASFAYIADRVSKR